MQSDEAHEAAATGHFMRELSQAVPAAVYAHAAQQASARALLRHHGKAHKKSLTRASPQPDLQPASSAPVQQRVLERRGCQRSPSCLPKNAQQLPRQPAGLLQEPRSNATPARRAAPPTVLPRRGKSHARSDWRAGCLHHRPWDGLRARVEKLK